MLLSRDVSHSVNESYGGFSAVSLRRIKDSRFASIVSMHTLFDRGIPWIPLSDCRCTLYSYTGFFALRSRRVRRRALGPGGTLSSLEKRRRRTYFENVVTQRTEPRRRRRPVQESGFAKGLQWNKQVCFMSYPRSEGLYADEKRRCGHTAEWKWRITGEIERERERDAELWLE